MQPKEAYNMPLRLGSFFQRDASRSISMPVVLHVTRSLGGLENEVESLMTVHQLKLMNLKNRNLVMEL